MQSMKTLWTFLALVAQTQLTRAESAVDSLRSAANSVPSLEQCSGSMCGLRFGPPRPQLPLQRSPQLMHLQGLARTLKLQGGHVAGIKCDAKRLTEAVKLDGGGRDQVKPARPRHADQALPW
jgi:hypothetical protein